VLRGIGRCGICGVDEIGQFLEPDSHRKYTGCATFVSQVGEVGMQLLLFSMSNMFSGVKDYTSLRSRNGLLPADKNILLPRLEYALDLLMLFHESLSFQLPPATPSLRERKNVVPEEHQKFGCKHCM